MSRITHLHVKRRQKRMRFRVCEGKTESTQKIDFLPSTTPGGSKFLKKMWKISDQKFWSF